MYKFQYKKCIIQAPLSANIPKLGISVVVAKVQVFPSNHPCTLQHLSILYIFPKTCVSLHFHAVQNVHQSKSALNWWPFYLCGCFLSIWGYVPPFLCILSLSSKISFTWNANTRVVALFCLHLLWWEILCRFYKCNFQGTLSTKILSQSRMYGQTYGFLQILIFCPFWTWLGHTA